mmetsp:Transcript_122690/g.392852  ORF Transcript_122690/g.392852 Transcript_122690/m.392852 type:complete len:229 (-) Transcript_122690:251-937(-)
MQSTPSSPPDRRSGPQCARARTGLACQCHLAGGLAAVPLLSSRMPHQTHTTPFTSPAATYRPKGSTDTAVKGCLCGSRRGPVQPSIHKSSTEPSQRAAAEPAASKGPGRSAPNGNTPARSGAKLAPLSFTRSTEARPTRPPRPEASSPPVTTNKVFSEGHRMSLTGASKDRVAKHAPVLPSQRRTSPKEEPVASGSAQPSRGVPAQTAVTLPLCGGLNSPNRLVVLAL